MNRLCLLFALVAISCDRGADERTRVVVLGFDGASWETIDPSIARGALPGFARWKREGAWGDLETFKPTKSPVIWTSLATGKSMLKHGILDFVYLEENDLPVPYDNAQRREPSLWQILDHFGRRSVVVNWFVTYPPDTIDGVVVSNRFRKTLLLKPEQRPRLADSVHPPEYFERLAEWIDADYERIRTDRGLPDLSSLYASVHGGRPSAEIPVLGDFSLYVLQEAFVENVSLHLYEAEDFDFFAAYFRLPDIVQHVAMHLVEPRSSERARSALAKGTFGEAEQVLFREEMASLLEPFYRYAERIISAFAAGADENTYLVVVSDHGFALHAGGYDHYHIPDDMPPPPGLFLMTGPEVRAGRVSRIGVYDVAPTILHLYGLPVGEDMDGRAVTEMFSFERPVRTQRYSRDLMQSGEARDDPEIDQKTIEELRSLGYIK